MTSPRFSWIAVLAVLAVGCDGTISVVFSTGPQEFEVSTASLSLPTELRDDMSGTIAMVPCGPMGMCPPASEVTLDCTAGFCDPAPRTISAPVGGVIDIDALLSDAGDVGLNIVDSYAVERVAYDISLNTLTVPTNEIVVFWGPEAATSVDPALGVRRFGTIPPIAAGATTSGNMAVDGAGVMALSDYLVAGNGRLRFFAQTMVDLDPGDPFPEGSVRMSVNVTIRAVGRLISR
ncbi:MAG: hypothetical protein H6719_13405 [Sandaracinaceae bacterium]|nr:hypothetical protein [Sandaracinaceae bacterium]